MFAASRTAVRRVASTQQRTLYLGKTVAEQMQAADAAKQGLSTYKWVSLAAFPLLAAVTYKAFVNQPEHERAEFVPYGHLRKLTKKFPWGDGKHTLFFNAHTQPTTEGYEDEH
eukprot:m.36983 g.36983  ORF g.36983 m.36983 type:complete len:113 (+) comp10060_c0_seq1:77-415(+)